jgi:hypothetical protein
MPRYNADDNLTIVSVSSIVEIRSGQKTEMFLPYSSSLEDRAFSIIYVEKAKYKTLNLVSKDSDTCSTWISSLHAMLGNQIEDSEPSNFSRASLSSWLRNRWDSVENLNQGGLDLDQITTLMKKINLSLSKREIKSFMKVKCIL